MSPLVGPDRAAPVGQARHSGQAADRRDRGARGPRPTLVVFDLDGTLADSEEGIMLAFHLTLEELGRHATDDELRQLIGLPLGASFAHLGVDETAIADVVARYREHYDVEGVPRCRLYAGVPEMLAALGDAGVRTAVATVKREDFARRILENLGVLGRFDAVSGAPMDALFNVKDEILGAALRAVGVAPSAWMVGDRRADVTAARAHGLVPVGVLWGYGSRDELVGAGATALFESPSQLARAVLGA